MRAIAMAVGVIVSTAAVAAAAVPHVGVEMTIPQVLAFVGFIVIVGPALIFLGRFTAYQNAIEKRQVEMLAEMREAFESHRQDVDKLWRAHNECRQQFADALMSVKMEGCGQVDCPVRRRRDA